MTYFVVECEAGPSWDYGQPMRQQEGWGDHAAYMNQIAEEGAVVLGGLLGTRTSLAVKHRAMLVIDAESEDAVRVLLANDPWSEGRLGKLVIAILDPWEILLGDPPSHV